VIFSSNIIKTPKSSRDGAERKKLLQKERKRKRGRKRKAPRVCSNKGEVNILRGEKHFNFSRVGLAQLVIFLVVEVTHPG
jgi:hypothetical protein